jgi:hypothetical protein
VDYNLEIEAEFPTEMIIEMQQKATERARKTVIGRFLAGRATFKELQDCLKLHLPASFATLTLLTRGFFEILFEDEAGARATRKLGAVEWSGWALSFSKYSALFRPNDQGAEKLLTHTIRVQFPDLHVQLRTEKALTIMANSIGEVLDIEAPDSYIKRPAGPMITVEVKDISKLAGIIRIPSMAEGAGPGDSIAQRILYSGLPNQCRKCRRFGHLARSCPINRTPAQGGNAPSKLPSEERQKKEPKETPGTQRWNTIHPRRKGGPWSSEETRTAKTTLNNAKDPEKLPQPPKGLVHRASARADPNGVGNTRTKDPELPPPIRTPDSDQGEGEPSTISPSGHRILIRDPPPLPTPVFSPRSKMLLVTADLEMTQAKEPQANSNPFAGSPGGLPISNAQSKGLEGPGEGWSFQGKKKKQNLPVKIHSPRQGIEPPTDPSSQRTSTPGGKRGQSHSELHSSYFESLGIPVPEGQVFCKAWVWPVLTRERHEKTQLLLHARNQMLPDLPLSLRITGPSEERWSQDSAQKDLTLRLEAELEEKITRYKLAIKDNIRLEWRWLPEPGKGGMECTILAYIWSGEALSIQNKRHLHWRDAQSILDLNNEVGAAVTAHSLLLKKAPPSSDHLAHKQKVASILASPQAARKKRFVKLDWSSSNDDPPAGANPFQGPQAKEGDIQHSSAPVQGRLEGSIDHQVALSPRPHV